MAFASQALTAHHLAPKPIGVAPIFPKALGWRFMLILRMYQQLYMITLRCSIYYLLWLEVRAASKILALVGLGDGNFASSTSLHEGFLSFFLRRFSSSWWIFWRVYFVFAQHRTDYIADYCEAWRLQTGFDKEIIMFVDNGHRLAIPCSSTEDDESLFTRLHTFYDLVRTGGGVFELFGAKSSQRIDIVELEHGSVGNPSGESLALGRHGPYNRQIHRFKNPSGLSGTSLRDKLIDEGVLTEGGKQQRALNIVRSWDPQVASIIVLLPVVLSLCLSVIWSVVASVCFKADVQASTQTGFTIGSYVVTAGTLLIALVAFLDSKHDTSDQNMP